MSRRTQLSTKYMFQVLAQLSENFIFIYLGLSLFTDNTLVFQPPLIIVTILAVCVARWVAVFPLSKLVNAVIRYRARNTTAEVGEELSYSYQAMLFWAGLRGAVGVALAALLEGDNAPALRATVLVVVVLTVIIFGGTTARMLEILGIRTGVVEEADSDDEFDIEQSFGTYAKLPAARNSSVALDSLRGGDTGSTSRFASGASSPNPSVRPPTSRKASVRVDDGGERSEMLAPGGSVTESDVGSDIDTSDLPPPARRGRGTPSPLSDGTFRRAEPSQSPAPAGVGAGRSIRQLLRVEDPAVLFRQLDEDFIKPTLLVDGGRGNGRGGGGGGSNV